jgi:hypothetical protein
MKVSAVLSVAFAVSGLAHAENTRGGRKLANINEDGLSKRQQHKKEMAEAGDEVVTEVAEEVITLDQVDLSVAAVDESVVVEEVPAPVSNEHQRKRGSHEEVARLDGLEDTPLEDAPLEAKGPHGAVPLEEGNHHGKGKGKHEGKPGNTLAGGHTKNLAAKGPKK